MTEQSETSTSESDLRRITVRRLAKVKGVTSRQLIHAVRSAVADHPIRAISVAVVDDATIAQLHERYLEDGRATDVLAFDLRDDSEDAAIDGEIVVSAEIARRQAERLGLTEGEEVLRYVIHGALHLLGHDDKTTAQRKKMSLEEDRILAALNSNTKATSKGQHK